MASFSELPICYWHKIQSKVERIHFILSLCRLWRKKKNSNFLQLERVKRLKRREIREKKTETHLLSFVDLLRYLFYVLDKAFGLCWINREIECHFILSFDYHFFSFQFFFLCLLFLKILFIIGLFIAVRYFVWFALSFIA